MALDPIVNGTGADRIVLWFLKDGRLYRKYYRFDSWIFVSGDPFDLDFLSRQLDSSSFDYEWTTRSDVYGEIPGMDISARPSLMKGLIHTIEQVGLKRKFRIYNGDLDPVMRFMSERGLEFFHLDSPLDHDPAVEAVSIGGRLKNNVLERIFVDGDSLPPNGGNFSYAADRIASAGVVVYDNRNDGAKRLLYRMKEDGIYLPSIRTGGGSTYQSYGQTHYKGPTLSMYGKICIPADSFIYEEGGLSGIYELSRTSSLPPETAAMVTPGTAVSTMEESIAIKNDVLIPLYKDDHEVEKSVDELTLSDRGGIALQPDPGLYEDVYEIDFSSMYPSIIVRYNLSPETIGRGKGYPVPDTPYSVDTGRRGFLPMALEKLLEKRLFYKSVKGEDDVYRMRDIALKWMLLTSFGYTGYKNAKFGKIEAHESITSIGRHVLSTAMKLAESHGFRVIHGIVDSLWIKGKGDVDALMRRIKEETRIDIVMDGHYKWIVFFPARSGLGSLNRYVGMRTDGKYKLRGIELRRSDVPEISRKFQMEALEIFEDCENAYDIGGRYGELVDLEKKYLESMHRFPHRDFLINIKITRRQEDYRVMNLQKTALRKLARRGVEVNPGQRIPIVVSDSKRKIVELEGEEMDIDKEFYRKQLYRAFESFDFLVSMGLKKRHAYTRKLTDAAFRY